MQAGPASQTPKCHVQSEFGMRINIGLQTRVKELVKTCKHVASRKRFISEKDAFIVYDIDERKLGS